METDPAGKLKCRFLLACPLSIRKTRMIRTRGTECLILGSLRPRANPHVQIRLLRHIRCICVLYVCCVSIFPCVEIHWQSRTNLKEGAVAILNCSIVFSYRHFCEVPLTLVGLLVRTNSFLMQQ